MAVSGCSQTVVREHQTAMGQLEAQQTWLGSQASQALGSQSEPDGFELLASGREAFAVRIGMIRQAERELDIQTYLLGDGQTTNLVFSQLIEAAERGVRVRLLVDDIGAVGQGARLAALASHANIHVRVYNPVSVGRGHLVTRVLASVTNPSQQHRRMHNKLWVADNSVAIVGGRNLGDEYFDADESHNFADLDLVSIGSVVPSLSSSFDLYWNHGLAQPIERYHSAGTLAWQSLRHDLASWLDENADSDYFATLRQQPKRPLWESLHWGTGQALWDIPGKLAYSGTPTWQQTLLGDLIMSTELHDRLIVISAYFVPTQPGVERLVQLARQGVDIEIITNSLESTDVALVHGAYAPWRQALLSSGIELYELRLQHEEVSAANESGLSVPGASSSALHIKAISFDDQLFVGSFNVDPRSILWNTEVGVLARSETLMEAFYRLAEVGRRPSISYQVMLDEQGELSWQFESEGEQQIISREPGGAWRHFNAWLSHKLRLERWL